MKIEQMIFKSRAWQSLKVHIPAPVRELLATGLQKIKSLSYALGCLFRLPGYTKNWAAIILKELFLPKGSCIRYHLRNSISLTIRAKSFDKFIVQEIQTGSYDIALKELSESPVVIDAGAHIGVFATKVLSKFPKARLFCIEPIPDNLELLRKNLSDNAIAGNVTVIESLLSKSEGIKTIYERKDHSAGFNLYMPTEFKYDVPSRTLEGVMRDNKITHCDLLKMDIEGGEYEVLMNTPTHVFEKIENIVMEYHPFPKETADIKRLSEFLSKNGYSLNFYSHKMLYATR